MNYRDERARVRAWSRLHGYHPLEGFDFCDDGHYGPTEAQVAFEERYCKETRHLPSLLEEGVEASTTDADNQVIANTLTDDLSFWSSTGTRPGSNSTAEEFLTYKLKHPLCVVHSVQISVYRALEHIGGPIYPPHSVSIYIGHSPKHLVRCTNKRLPIEPIDTPQIILLPYVMQPIGGYLQIRFHGKQQMQNADQEYYIAIRHVCARGLQVPVSCLHTLQPVLNSTRLHQRSASVSARDVSQLCTLPNGRSILEEIHKRTTGVPEEEQMDASAEESTREAQLTWTLAEGECRVDDCYGCY